jgi:hypothetical protein
MTIFHKTKKICQFLNIQPVVFVYWDFPYTVIACLGVFEPLFLNMLVLKIEKLERKEYKVQV